MQMLLRRQLCRHSSRKGRRRFLHSSRRHLLHPHPRPSVPSPCSRKPVLLRLMEGRWKPHSRHLLHFRCRPKRTLSRLSRCRRFLLKAVPAALGSAAVRVPRLRLHLFLPLARLGSLRKVQQWPDHLRNWLSLLSTRPTRHRWLPKRKNTSELKPG